MARHHVAHPAGHGSLPADLLLALLVTFPSLSLLLTVVCEPSHPGKMMDPAGGRRGMNGYLGRQI